VLTGASAVAGVAALTACGADEPTATAPAPDESSADPTPTEEPSKTGGAEEPSQEPTEPLAQLADIPVGGALLVEVAGNPVVVSQPSKGNVVAFSAVCTHQGCTVAVGETQLSCPCHGSTFDFSGKVVNGPAEEPLPDVAVKVSGDAVLPA
jgi:Rieske Fe-S protein